MPRTTRTRKVTFALPEELAREVREVVAAGVFPSQNVLVREALQKELKRVRAQRLRATFEEAAEDPLFLRDLAETEESFADADAETARTIPDG